MVQPAPSQSEIREKRKKLEKIINQAEKELIKLQKKCSHPRMERGKYLGRVSFGQCPDCGYEY